MDMIEKVFEEKPNGLLKELFTKWQQSYNKEIKCKDLYARTETSIEHNKINAINNLMATAGLNITSARNKVEGELLDDRLELINIDKSIQHYRMEKKLYRLLIEYMMD